MAQEQGRRATTDVAPVQLRAFLIADVRGYTRFTAEQGNEAATELATQFAGVVRSAVSEHGGELLELRGDEAMCVFPLALQALRASVEVQRRLRTESDDGPPLPLGVGIGIDVGEAVLLDGGYRGAALNVAARLCALAGPGQILATDIATRLAGGLGGVRYAARRPVKLKGLAEPVRVTEVAPETPLPPLPPSPRRGPEGRRRLIASGVVAALLAATAIPIVVALRGGGSPPPSKAASRPVTQGIWRIDAKTNQITRAIPLGVPLVSPSLMYGFGSVWATYEEGPNRRSQGIAKIDPTTLRVHRFVLHGAGPLGVCGSHLCSAGGEIGESFITVLDPHDPLGGFLQNFPAQPFNPDESQAGFYLATGFDSLWVRESGFTHCCEGRVFWRFDVDPPYKVLGRWRNPDAFAVGDEEGVWVIYGEKLESIDPKTNAVERISGVPHAWTVAVGNGAVWVGDFSLYGTTLREINPQTGVVLWHHYYRDLFAVRIIAGDGRVWLEDLSHRTLTRVDAFTHRAAPPIKFPVEPGAMALSPGAVWVRFPEGDDPYRNRDARIF